ncbi:uncharacterized protein RHIMIDRAFT_291587 [Rhizopus microsporus ATCC 52813]|uniref:Uncharacterized protein n=1 Tax=Rhizopus microsporus ATCC 52813 TaxID=1340429 RepID=A0A2G4SW71_RHIZD|nr:uncharacterized protein RHIMIDRAFT_291587 [Rhizopus microsporus ATCC 52813]PHZ13019.1 hypothetical protein RHIMIDRAFT_291587 [Rhizopus microsporus ATCC 52813]
MTLCSLEQWKTILLEQPYTPTVLRYCQQIHAIAPAKRAEKELQHHDTDVELNKKSRKADHFLTFVLWTLDGSVQLQLLPDLPEYLKDLLERTDTHGHHFKDNLRQYNAAFAFTLLGCDIISPEDRVNNNSNNNNNRGELNAFQIHGALCHCQGPLTPIKGSEPSYAQLYIFDPYYAAERR